MLEQRIQQQFFESADLQYQGAEALSRQVSEATQALLTAITSGGKVLLCGSGWGSSLAHHAHSLLLAGFERERPPLAALLLRATPELSTAQQVQALAQPGDVLWVLACGKTGPGVLAAAQEARTKDATVAVFCDGAAAAQWQELLSDTDVVVAVPHERSARAFETHVLAIHCLCDALDLQLLGEQDPS
jgi:D-sedoheptulose 7-phosphate isomerase